MSKLSDISSDVFKFDFDEDSNLSIASIIQWFRSHIGSLNNLINKDYTIHSTTYEIIDGSGTEIDEQAVAIFKKMYEIAYLKRLSRSNLGASSYDIVQIQSDGANFRTVSKNDTAKTYNQMAKDCQDELKQLLNTYRLCKYSALQVQSDDKYPRNGVINNDYSYNPVVVV